MSSPGTSSICRRWRVYVRHRTFRSCAPELLSSLPRKAWRAGKSASVSSFPDRSSPNGANASCVNAWPASRTGRGADARALFPPPPHDDLKSRSRHNKIYLRTGGACGIAAGCLVGQHIGSLSRRHSQISLWIGRLRFRLCFFSFRQFSFF